MNNTWIEDWRILYGQRLSSAESEAMERYLDREFPARNGRPGLSEGELSRALSAIAEKARKRGDKAYPPTAPAVKTAIIAARHEARQQGQPEAMQCAACHHGWVTVRPNLGETPELEAYMLAYTLGVPCTCPAGVKLYEIAETYKKGITIEARARLEDLARLGVRQWQHIEQGGG
jgi:hypothetical protein